MDGQGPDLFAETLKHLEIVRNSACDVRRLVLELRRVASEKSEHLDQASRFFHWRHLWREVIERSRGEVAELWKESRHTYSLDTTTLLAKLTCWGPAGALEIDEVPGIPSDFIRLCCAIPHRIVREVSPSLNGEIVPYRSSQVRPNAPFNLIYSYGEGSELLRKISGEVNDGLLYREEGEIKGFISWKVEKSPRELRVLVLWVDPLERRRGIASELLKRAAGTAVKSGSENVVVEVSEPTDSFRKMLLSNDFYLVAHPQFSIATAHERRQAFGSTAKRVLSNQLHQRQANSFIQEVGSLELVKLLCQARRAYHRMSLPPPSNREILKTRISHLHSEDQLSGVVRALKAEVIEHYRAFRREREALIAKEQTIHECISSGTNEALDDGRIASSFAEVVSTFTASRSPLGLLESPKGYSLHPIHWKYRKGKPIWIEGGHLVPLEDTRHKQVKGLYSSHGVIEGALTTSKIAELARIKEGALIGLLEDGALTGFGAAIFVRDSLEVISVVVEHSATGRGYGSKIVDYFIDLGMRAGSQEVVALVDENNDAAIHLFANCGFKGVAVEKGRTLGASDNLRFVYPLHG